jgi:hypothetical protein
MSLDWLKPSTASKHARKNKSLKKKTSLEWLSEKLHPTKPPKKPSMTSKHTRKNKSLKKKTSLEWLSEKLIPSKANRVHIAPEAELTPSTRRDGTKTYTYDSVRLDSGPNNTVVTKEGVEPVCRIDMSDFEYHVFLSHLQELKLADDSAGADVRRLAQDMVTLRVFDRMDAAMSFCHILDATSVHTGYVVESNIRMLDTGISVGGEMIAQCAANQAKLKQYIDCVNNSWLQTLLERGQAPPPPENVVSIKENRRISHMFTITRLKTWLRHKKWKRKWSLLACDRYPVLIFLFVCTASKRQRRVSLLRDQILTRMQPGNEGLGASQPAAIPSASHSTGQEMENAETGGDDEKQANSSRLKYSPVIYPSADSRRRSSSMLTAEQIKVIEAYIEQYLGYVSEDEDEDEDEDDDM